MSWWGWTGVGERRWTKRDDEEVRPGKTLWDWLQLLVVPVMLAGVAFAFNASQSRREEHREDQRIAADRMRAEDVRHEQNLQRYFDRISDLLLNHGLRDSRKYAVVRDVARNVTLATLRGLDGRRKAEVVAFLDDAWLIGPGYVAPVEPDVVVSLAGADLSDADFRAFDGLHDIDLSKANLRGARFDGTRLQSILMRSADLRGASFRSARIYQAGLDDADLKGAHFDDATIGGPPPPMGGSSPYGAVFDRACLTGASFDGAHIRFSEFTHAEGHHLHVRGVHVGGWVKLNGSDLPGLGADRGDVRLNDRVAPLRHHPCAAV